MVSAKAEQEILRGMLAHQLGFVSRKSLLDAINDWAGDESRSLCDVFVARRALDATQRATLDAVAESCMAHHDGDAGKCLTALDALSALREEIFAVCERDAEATMSFVALSSASESESKSAASREDFLLREAVGAGDAGRNQSVDDGDVESLRGGRFRVLRGHAAGGLGRVFVAEDMELGREVALKELKGDHADRPESRARFMQEAEITGGLEHPGIVPVYSLGQNPDGRPFYAMRFIKGDSLKEAITAYKKRCDDPRMTTSERSLGLRRLLDRFLDVCHAIEYAHRRGVVHRDLKPSNIMLGEFGETLVVDWGLAKALGHADAASETPLDAEPAFSLSSGSGSAETQFGSVLGTPAFMSPEQATGDLNAVGPASDIYSLGATLYCILAGRPPFTTDDEDDRSPQELLEAIRNGDCKPPSEWNPRVPKPLEAICRKAMARRLEDRYPSVEDLARDIERFLADEMIDAYEEPVSERLSRWTRRYRTLVRAAAASLFLIACVAVGAAFQINAQRERAEAAHALEAKAHKEEAIARRKAEKVVEYMVAALRSPDPSRGGDSITVAEVLEQAMKETETHLADEPLIRAEMLSAIGKSYQGLGLPERAASAFEPARDILREALGEDHEQTRSAVNNLTNSYLASGRLGAAVPILQTIMKGAQDRLADVDPKTQATFYNLKEFMNNVRRPQPEVLIPVIEGTLRMNRSINGKRHPQTRKLALNLAKAYIVAGNREDAVAVAKDYGLEDEVQQLQVLRRNPNGQPPEPR